MTCRVKKTCTGPECVEPARSLGLCAIHYQQHHAGRELTPLVGSKGRSFRVGEKLYHGQRPCTFVAKASPEFLMIAAMLDNHSPSDRQWVADIAARCTTGSKASVVFVIYDEDRSVGLLTRSKLSRQPREASKSHWYIQQRQQAG